MICSAAQLGKNIFFTVFFFISFLSGQEPTIFLGSSLEFALRSEDERSEQDKDDEKLSEEIYAIGAMFYKNVIDMSALYFSGILLDSGQLYDRAMFDLGKHLFHVVKSFAWYGPKMMQNPKLSWKIKAKKTMYMTSFLIVCWIWYMEISNNKKNRNMHGVVMDEAPHHRSISIEPPREDLPQHRPRLPSWA